MKLFADIELDKDGKNVYSIYYDKWNGEDYLHIRKAFWSNQMQKYMFTKEGISLKKENFADFFIAISKAATYLQEEKIL